MNRRDFNKLSLAALSGAVAGSLAGCGGEPAKMDAPKTDTGAATGKPGEPAVAAAEVHLCRGLNSCKTQGADGKNECAGQGTCASKSAHHTCGGQNACKGQGGCGETAGANECKTKGGCEVPLMSGVWKKVRARFEEKMKKEDKKFGDAPPAPKA